MPERMPAPMTTAPAVVTVSPTTLAEVWAFACQSGEFVALVGYLADEGNGRCAWGVLHTMLDRMGIVDQDERNGIVLGLAEFADRAAARLGYAQVGIVGANDAGCTLAEIGRHSGRNRQRADEGVRVIRDLHRAMRTSG